MSSKQRQAAIASGKIVENAEAVRRRRRQEASILREQIAIELYAEGKKLVEIEDELFDKTGSRCHGQIKELIQRGLYRRVAQGSQSAQEAREMLLTQYGKLLEVYMPRALGAVTDPDTGLQLPPDVRAAELALRILDKAGIVSGAIAPPRSGDINLNIGIGAAPVDADEARRQALQKLDAQRAKLMEIEGSLADTPAVEGGDEASGDEIPPPFDLPTTPA